MSAHEHTLSPSAPARRPSMFWTVVWGYIMLTIFIVFVLFFIGRPAVRFESAEVLRERERMKIREDVLAAAQKELNAPAAWLNKEKGVVHLPIQDAMALTVERLNTKKPRPANPIETPAAATATPPPATTNSVTPNAATPPAAPAAPAATPAPAPAATPAPPK